MSATAHAVQLQHAVTCLDGRRVPVSAEERADRNGDYPYWGANGVIGTIDDYLFDETLVLLGEDGAPFFDPTKPVAFCVEGKIWVNNHMHVLRPRPGFDPRYLAYALNATDYGPWIEGSTRDKLTQESMGAIRIPARSLADQRAIADYLDTETARIDALIDAQERRMALARERMQSGVENLVLGRSVSQCVNVAEGPLFPVAPGWRARRNKTFLREVTDLSETGDEELLTVSHLTGVTPRTEKDVAMFLADTNEGYKRVKPGDLVINTMWAWMGALGVSSHTGIVSPAYGVYHFVDESADPRYFDLLFRSRAYVTEMTRHSKGVWTSRLRLYPEAFLALRSPFPPIDDQKEIAARAALLQTEQRRIEVALRHSVALLLERRHALITAAVTGQLEISGVAA